MCINIALPAEVRVNNHGQRLAGTGVFVSKAGGGARYDDPVALNICRLHFEERHGGDGGGWGEIPERFSVAVAPMPVDEDEDVVAYRQAIMSDTPIGRGFWKTATKKYFYLPCFDFGAEKYCTEGNWAAVAASVIPNAKQWQTVAPGESISLGGWQKDGYGCFLSFALPVGAPIELTGEGFKAGPSGLIYQVGSLGIKIPWGTEWALWIRCSDSGTHSGFLVVRLEWYKSSKCVAWYPVLASMFKAPHVFPARGYFFEPEPCELPDFGSDVHAAVRLAEHIAAHGFTIPKELPQKHIYDALAAEHATGNSGVFGVSWNFRGFS